MKKVFISYSWDNEDYSNKVRDFANQLISSGYDVHIDKREMEDEYSIDLQKMMYKGLTEADKVIVLLSECYKKKAEAFSGGVGQEFKLILADIENHRKKYILASLLDFTSPILIAPLAFQSRFIYNLASYGGMALLYNMLEEKLSYGFRDNIEKLHVSKTFVDDVYRTFLSSPESSYFNYKGKAGEAYAAITRMNVKVGDWKEFDGIDHTAIYYIAEAIKRNYDNIWTRAKSVNELAHDITQQIIAYLIWKESQASTSGAYGTHTNV